MEEGKDVRNLGIGSMDSAGRMERTGTNLPRRDVRSRGRSRDRPPEAEPVQGVPMVVRRREEREMKRAPWTPIGEEKKRG